MKKSRSIKKIICLLLIILLCFVTFVQSNINSISMQASSISELEQKIKDCENEIKENKELIEQTRDDAEKERENQQAIKDQIIVTQTLIQTLNTKINELDNEIEDTNALLTQQEADISTGIEEFKLRLRAMYLSGNDSVASVMLGSSSFFDMLMKLEMCERIAERDNQMIEDLIALKNEYEATKQDLETKKAEKESTKAEYEKQEQDLNDLFEQSQLAIEELTATEAILNNEIDDLEEKEEEAEKELQRIIEEENKKNKTYVGGEFTWPVPGFTHITSPFGMRTLFGVKKMHKGIDISSWGIYRAPIVAANSGTVIVAQKSYTPGYSYGRYVVIDHGGGKSTLYAHCDSIDVNVGDWVTQGDTIAYVGTTGRSTGYHLHFEIRINGVQQNPMNYYN